MTTTKTHTKRPHQVRSIVDFQLLPGDMESPQEGTITLQGDATSIKEILNKSTQGQDLTRWREGVYAEDATHDDPDHSKIRDMDLVDRDQLHDQAKQKAAQQLDLLTAIADAEEEKRASEKKSRKFSEEKGRSEERPEDKKRAPKRDSTEEAPELDD